MAGKGRGRGDDVPQVPRAGPAEVGGVSVVGAAAGHPSDRRRTAMSRNGKGTAAGCGAIYGLGIFGAWV